MRLWVIELIKQTENRAVTIYFKLIVMSIDLNYNDTFSKYKTFTTSNQS